MPKNEEQKIKYLILYEMLLDKTDERNTMTAKEIIAELANRGITLTRKTLYKDIETLNNNGYEVMCDRRRVNHYYISDRKFERSEVQILLNAVGVTPVLSNKKKSVLIEKLLQLLGGSDAESLLEITPYNSGYNNERLYYSIDAITTAITEKRKLSFLYFDYAINGRREYRKDKSRYEVNPLGMVYNEDKLYLVCYHDKYGDPANYRIDRMDEVRAENEPITHMKEYDAFDIAEYRRQQFGMYHGEMTEVELIFPQDVLEVMIDRFGEDVKPVSHTNGYKIRVKVQISKAFFAWLTTFEGRVNIYTPESVKQEYREFINKLNHRVPQ